MHHYHTTLTRNCVVVHSDKKLGCGANEYKSLGSLVIGNATLNSLNFLNSLYCRYNPLRDIAQARNE